ncbi:RHTO0S07e00980g1_1 [Rhodotorula toruloides]|uniref:RHTO0S07e00980g1_1 n=1 Tax=Rhodotorula toruloides TaxID=5286 RepID=A0A061AZB5_RHOTO|nr:RHTO0S07e00980g1_1 [Rhodotorula toruloides]
MDDDDSTSEASYSQYMPRHAHPHSARPLFNEQTPALSHAPTPSYFADQQQPVASTSAQPYTAAMNGYAGTGYGDEEDELDDLQSATEDEDEDSSDEEALAEQQLRAVQAKKMEAVKGLYKGERVLPEEEFGSKTVREIYDMLKAGVINLSPDYQREAVWPETHSAGLIESLLRNMHVPELLFNIYPRPLRQALQARPPRRPDRPGEQGEVASGLEGRVGFGRRERAGGGCGREGEGEGEEGTEEGVKLCGWEAEDDGDQELHRGQVCCY